MRHLCHGAGQRIPGADGLAIGPMEGDPLIHRGFAQVMEQGGHDHRRGLQIMLPGNALRLSADRQQSPPAHQQRLVDNLQRVIQQPSRAGMMVGLGSGQLLHEAGVLPDGPQYQGLVLRAGQAGQPGDLGSTPWRCVGLRNVWASRSGIRLAGGSSEDGPTGPRPELLRPSERVIQEVKAFMEAW